MTADQSQATFPLEISASFTAEPLEPALSYWFSRSKLTASTRFAPYQQIFQTLLNPDSSFRKNENGLNVILLRPEDWQRFGDSSDEVWEKALRENTREFISLLEEIVAKKPARYLLVITEASEATTRNTDRNSVIEELVAAIDDCCRRLRIACETPASLQRRYPVPEAGDPVADREGHIPYRDSYYQMLATVIARRIHALITPPLKVIVVDADHTLWPGVAAESRSGGLSITPPYRALQQFLKERQEAGILLCLASKNEDIDVREAFQSLPGMVLQESDFVGWKVNWERKSQNIAELASQLNLALDSFLFIDDNPVEIAEVSTALPAVDVALLPDTPEEIAPFLANHWRLDLANTLTEEDGKRTHMYRTMIAREEVREKAPDYATFLRELALEITFPEVTAGMHPRIAQLTQRTSQFNTTTISRSEDDLADDGSAEVLAIEVSDRFGHYGLVGAVFYQVSGTTLFAENILLSCRVLGKGVEDAALKHLAKIAAEAGANELLIPLRTSERNFPARQFLDQFGSDYRQTMAGETCYRLPLEVAAAGRPQPTSEPAQARTSSTTRNTSRLSSDDYCEIAGLAIPADLNTLLHQNPQPRPDLAELFEPPVGKAETVIAEHWCQLLKIAKVGRKDRFADLGGKSLHVSQLAGRLAHEFEQDVTASDLFQNATVADQAAFLTIRAKSHTSEAAPSESESSTHQEEPPSTSRDIAIVGMSCRLPESPDVHQFWQNLLAGKECLTQLSDAELLSAGVNPVQVRQDPSYVPVKGLVDNVENFDANFFGILPNEAKVMDPQHRVFLELAWEALEDAGYNPETYQERIGVWAGNYLDTYALANLATDREWLQNWIPEIQVGSLGAGLGNDKDYLATRVAYKLDLRGPAMTVQSACSTSLVAIAQACQSLRAGGCEMALAGGITLTLPEKKGYHYTPDGILSQDGSCRAFDEKASGTVFSNGAGIIVLKRLDDSLRDGDHIHAVIKGCALNNDGGRKHSFTAPSIDGQAAVISDAIRDANVDAATISYVESHGTGTPLGDPIEVAGLTKAFRELGVTHNQECALGTVKTNVGHLDVASGVTATIKTAFALEHGKLPATLHFQKGNPKIDFANSPFRVQDQLSDWRPEAGPRRAGISSFGVGGTNAHLVLQEPPAAPSEPSPRRYQVLVQSARSEEALTVCRERLANFCKEESSYDPADVAHTLRIGRKHFAHRSVTVSDDLASLANGLSTTGTPKQADPPLVLLFPGQGAQTVGMARDLYQSEPYFKDELDRCAEILLPLLGEDLRDILFPSPEADQAAAAKRIQDTVMAQPTIFVVSYCQARLLLHWGLRPEALVGHSVGELVAATLAGVFSLEDALRVLSHRGRLMQAVAAGGMVSVRLSEEELLPLLPATLDLAAVNGPGLCVVAGPHPELEAFGELLSRRDIAFKALHTSHAFHSRMMDEVVAPFEEVIAATTLSPPQVPIRSTVTTGWLTDEEATDPHYWSSHLRQTVRFTAAAAHFCKTPESTLLEVGPGQTLSTLSKQVAERKSKQAIFSVSGHATDQTSDALHFQFALGQLWLHGHVIDWESYQGDERRKRVPLPTYPFERKRYWIDPKPLTSETPSLQALPPTQPAVAPSPEPTPTSAMPTDRKPVIHQELCLVLEELSGIEPEEMELSVSLLELGFDSLTLTQVSKEVEKSFGVATTMRQLLAELPTIGAIVNFLDEKLESTRFQAPAQDVPAAAIPSLPTEETAAPPTLITTGESNTALAQMLAMQMQQMQLMQQQLHQLAGGVNTPQAPATAAISAMPVVAGTTSPPAPPSTPALPAQSAVSQNGAVSGATTSISREEDSSLTSHQREHLESLIGSYVARTKKSKEWTARYRKYQADPRTVSGFNRAWKEMIYQIVVSKSKGSRLLDLDGNEYIDILNGFGPGFFGHSPDFVNEAIARQTAEGIAVGPQTPLAGETAQLFCELTGNERCSFVCTGSEAVQAAMRLARTATGRDKIAVFTKDYHGNFDEVLLRGTQNKRKPRTFPSAPGVPKAAVSNMLVLDYGSDESLEILNEQAHELAAIMIEPVQSRRPELQPHDFIKSLRELTDDSGALLIFDEVICGLRDGPRGAQGLYDVQSDISTYGKVVGGGLPIGIVAGKAKYMDIFDGGHWEYGDDSFPEGDVTFFAGTFHRHPLGIAATHAVLTHLQTQGPELWRTINERAERLYKTVDQFMVDHGVPIRLPGLHSRFFIRVSEDFKYGNLLFFHLRKRGVYLLEGFPSYITTAHTDSDIDYVIRAFKESVAELQAGGFVAETSAVKLLQELQLPGPDPILAPRRTAAVTSPAVPEALATPQRREKLPLTEGQREIWMACQLGQEATCSFNEATTLAFDGPLNRQSLEKALAQVVNHHDALRSSFDEDGEYWTILDSVQPKMTFRDLSLQPDSEKIEAIQLATETQAFTPFDLATAPLVRASLFKLGPARHILLLTAHHIVADGWSFNVIIENLSDCYNAAVKGMPNPLLPAASFANYALGQEKSEQLEDTNSNLTYWLKEFPDQVPVLNLPTDRPFQAQRTFSASTLYGKIDSNLRKKLRRAGAASGATLYATTLTAFQILLERITGQRDVVIGIPAAGQSSQDLGNLVGHCVNFLPLRVKLEEGVPFSSQLKETAETVMGAIDHQDCTYGRIVPKLAIPRLAGRMPLAEIAFNLERMDYFRPFDGLECEFVANPKSFLNQLLFLNLVESQNEIAIEVSYNTDLFDQGTVQGWLESYIDILTRIAEDPTTIGETKQADTPPLPSPDREPLPLSANNVTDYPRTSTVQQLFEEVAATHPDRVALQMRDWTLSYRTLNQLANRLARRIRKEGITANQPVPVLLDRSFDYIIAILAVLKAGGGYVPIDPDYPVERIHKLIASLDCPLLLTRSTLLDRVPKDLATNCLAIDEIINGTDPDDAEAGNLPSRNRADDLAYLMFTSGSTGISKGVEIAHRGITRLVKETNYADLSEEQVYLQASALSFDASTFEIWAPLLNGGRLILLPPGPPTLDGIAAEIAEHNVTTLWLTSGLFQLMIDEKIGALAPLRQLIAGGDVLSKHHVAKLARALPQLRLINGYGPTENTTFTCCHTIQPEDLQGPAIPIGRPISNTEVYLLDENLNPLPPLTEGELFFGGDGLARGYFKNPELTAEKFISNPFSTNPDARLYRSGDRARYRPDGIIEFLGRRDQELKVRGFRIEPSEVEDALCKHPSITQARVVARGNSAEEKRLLAYVLSSSSTSDEAELKSFLQRSLPAYLLPARILVVETLPVTENGKIDDRALAKIEPEQTSKEEPARAPEGKAEIEMAQLWEETLGLADIPANRSFFDLGGQSLQALKLFHRIQKTFQKKLPLSTLFERPTVAELAELVRTKTSSASTLPGLSALKKEGDHLPLFCIHGGDGGTLIYRNLASHLPDDRPIYTLEAPALSGEATVAETVEETAELYLAGIRKVQPSGPYLIAGYCFGGIVAYEIAQQLKKAGEAIELLCLFDTDNPAVAPRYLSLAERAARNWQDGTDKSWAGRIGKLSGRFGEGLVNKVRTKTEKAAATVISSTGLETGGKLQTVIVREAHDRAMSRYTPKSYQGDVLLFTAEDQGDGVVYPSHLGWEGFVQGHLNLQTIPGSHLTIFEEPYVTELAKQLKELLCKLP